MQITSTNERWNLDTILNYLEKDGCEVGFDNDAQIILYTGIWEWPDGTLNTEPPDDS